MKILLFDNYDSFTYNLLHILKEFGADTEVFRNDRITRDSTRSSCRRDPGFRRRLASCCR